MTRIERAYACIRQAVEELSDHANDSPSVDELNACVASIVKLEDVAIKWKTRTRWRHV